MDNYYDRCKEDGCTQEQLLSLDGMIKEFVKWRDNNPDKMKQPGSTMPEDMKKFISSGNEIKEKPKKDEIVNFKDGSAFIGD